MNKIKAIAVDDEPLALWVINSHAEKMPFMELSYSTTKVIDALAYLQQNHVDVIFLDVQMPELTGFQFMKILNSKAKIVLTTAYQEYALDSYEYDVIDYLLKPISFERLLKATQKAFNQIQTESFFSSGQRAENIDVDTVAPIDCLFIKTEYKLQKVFYSDILYLEGGKDYVTIFTKTEKILSLAGLAKIQQSLPAPQFLRVHKSYIVALNKIDTVERQRIFIGNEVIPVSDTYKDEFSKSINKV